MHLDGAHQRTSVFPAPPTDADHGKDIATLAEKLQVPVHQVHEIYSKEFERLASHARIGHFLDVLTLRNTRSILRSNDARAARG